VTEILLLPKAKVQVVHTTSGVTSGLSQEGQRLAEGPTRQNSEKC